MAIIHIKNFRQKLVNNNKKTIYKQFVESFELININPKIKTQLWFKQDMFNF